MELIRIYQCFCDRTRLRILNLLQHGPLCVCHLQRILGEPQVKISKHLAYLRGHQLVESERCANWMVYHLPEEPSELLKRNLACLQDSMREESVFQRDLDRLKEVLDELGADCPACVREHHQHQNSCRS
ncbi:MAG: ArsR family transcriptional regulator [Verrucomicrobia bacterium]|nr:MAG: ArsR family transcriptional regulator [Verrucomicrobiota bacterium]